MNALNFNERRRQPFLDEISFNSTMKAFEEDYAVIEQDLLNESETASGRAELYAIRAQRLWSTFQLRFTVGHDLDELASYLTHVVEAYEAAALALEDVPEDEYSPLFLLDEMVDNYVDYLNLLSAAALLHREELIPRICALNDGTEYDKSDGVIENLLGFYLPERPILDELYWEPYVPLLSIISLTTPSERQKRMEKYVKGWYKSMKGIAHFWGKHEQIKPEYSPYDGYWCMCAAAFTYLYDIDDSSYCKEMTYPKDMIDYARTRPRKSVKLENGGQFLKVLGGQPCPLDGQWFTPAKPDSARHFKKGDLMPEIESEYGLTIWQLQS